VIKEIISVEESGLRIIYIDCTAGLSGGALLGALADLGLDREQLFEELQQEIAGAFNVSFNLSFQKEPRRAALRTALDLSQDCLATAAGEFIKTFFREESAQSSPFPMIKKIFQEDLAARSRLEGLPPEEVTVTPAEAIKTAILAAGVFAALKQLGFPRIVASPVPIGPPPLEGAKDGAGHLVLELAKGAAVRPTSSPSVYVSPAGVAILTRIADEYGELPEMELEETGYGALGDYGRGGVVRVLYGSVPLAEPSIGRRETVLVIETGIDDMNPEFFPYLIERLLAAGALDAFLIPIYMKKGRPANLLKVLCKGDKLEQILQIIFKESTTLGVRIHEETRRVLQRKFFQVSTPYGEVTVKAGYAGPETVLQLAPEFEDCKRIASGTGTPLKEVYAAAQRSAFEKIKEQENRER
jgi:uncharacterized protein (DUF111 family)